MAQLAEADTIKPEVGGKQHDSLTAALVAAQAQMPAVEADAVNPHFGSRFVSLGRLIAKVRPVLNRHGIAVVQMPAQDEQGRPVLVTRLVHASGEVMESTMPLMLAKNDPQSLGSALTYAKRYALAAALAIADQEDDDGNAATAPASSVQPANDKQLEVLSKAVNYMFPPDLAAKTWDSVEGYCGGTISGPVALALIAVIKARKDLEADEDAPVEVTDGIEAELPAEAA